MRSLLSLPESGLHSIRAQTAGFQSGSSDSRWLLFLSHQRRSRLPKHHFSRSTIRQPRTSSGILLTTPLTVREHQCASLSNCPSFTCWERSAFASSINYTYATLTLVNKSKFKKVSVRHLPIINPAPTVTYSTAKIRCLFSAHLLFQSEIQYLF